MLNPCGCPNPNPPALMPADLETAKGQLSFSTSNVFRGPDSGSTTLSLISLLQHSRTGNLGIHSVDVDIRTTQGGVTLTRGNGEDLLYEGGSRSWKGADNGLGLLGSATEFSLVLGVGDVVVIDWTEIR